MGLLVSAWRSLAGWAGWPRRGDPRQGGAPAGANDAAPPAVRTKIGLIHSHYPGCVCVCGVGREGGGVVLPEGEGKKFGSNWCRGGTASAVYRPPAGSIAVYTIISVVKFGIRFWEYCGVVLVWEGRKGTEGESWRS